MSVRLRERGGGSGRVSAASGQQPRQASKDLRIKPSVAAKGSLPASSYYPHGTHAVAGKENRSQRNPSAPRQRPSVSDHSTALRRSVSVIPVSAKVAVPISISGRRSGQGSVLEGARRKESGVPSLRCREEKSIGGCQARMAVRVTVGPEERGVLVKLLDGNGVSPESVGESKENVPDVFCSLAQSGHLAVHSKIKQKVPISSSFASSSSLLSSSSAACSSSSSSYTSTTTATVTGTASISTSSPSSSSSVNPLLEVPNVVDFGFPVSDSLASENQTESKSASYTTESEDQVENGKVSENIIVFESKRSCSGQEDPGVACRSYPSKVHEKLALLEGRVRRIASDIERTKEMLNKSDGETTKKMLSDIQDRICGIERDAGAAASVAREETQTGPSGPHAREEGVPQLELEEGNGIKETETARLHTTSVPKISVKVMNPWELEARFFPHQRLLKDRGILERLNGQSAVPCEDTEDKIGSLLNDEQHITSEFLASLESDLPWRKNLLPCSTSGTTDESLTLGWQRMGSDGSGTKSSGLDSEILDPVRSSGDTVLMSDEAFDDQDDQENRPFMAPKEESDEQDASLLFDVGYKPSTGGWFVSEGEAVLLAHSDGSCSYYDVINQEEKSEYKPPADVPANIWGDCWLIRAPGVDGCSGKYVVAASAGSTLNSGFCSWDFYTRSIKASRFDQDCGISEDQASSSTTVRSVLAPLPVTGTRRRIPTTTTTRAPSQAEQWWYRPCGCLVLAASSMQSVVSAYDIRDGALAMAWSVGGPLASMECSSPLQWRSKGKVVAVGADSKVALWDVGSLNPQPVLSVAACGGGDDDRVVALHVNNTEAEVGGGVRQRVSSSAVEGNDGVFCIRDTISVLDFRLPSGVGLNISNPTATATHSVFSQGDTILAGSTAKPSAVAPTTAATTGLSVLQRFSLRAGKLQAAYPLPDDGVHASHSALVQVWGGSGLLMGISGMGMFVFDGDGFEDGTRVGPDDLYSPSFDYLGGRLLVISKDRPAMWKYLR